MPAPKINYALAATLLASGMPMSEIAPQVGAKNANVLKVGLCKKGVNARLAQSPPQANRVSMSLVQKVANQASEILKRDMGDVLASHTSALKQVPSKVDLEHIQKVGNALEPLARAAKLVYSWGDEQIQGIVSLGVVEQIDQAQDALEVESSVSQATITSVPEQAQEPVTPQE